MILMKNMIIFKKIFLINLMIQYSYEIDDNIETILTNKNNNNNNNPISSDERVIQLYINDIRLQADFTKNPCDNYENFACANLQNIDKIGYRFHKKDAFYFEEFLLNEPTKSEPEQRAKDFYLSCRNERDIKQIFEQIPTLKSIGKWPTNKNFTNIEIAELMAEMAAIVEMFLIKIQIKQNLIFLEGTQPLRLENMENIIKLMEDFGSTPDDAQTAVHDIAEFLDKLENIFRYFSPETITDVQFQNRNILQRKIPNFNWNAYLMKFFTSLNLKLDSLNYDLRTKNLELLEKITILIDKTDRKTIVNYLIYKYIQFGTKHNCEEFLPYFRPLVAHKLWQKYMNHDDELRHLQSLNNFEKSYMKLKENQIIKRISSSHQQTNDKILEKIKNRKNIINNHTQILNNDILQKHYDSFIVVPNEIYTNQINFYHMIVRDFILHGENGKFNQLHYAFLEGLGGEIDIMANNKPLLYYFVSENIELWRNTFDEYKPWNQQNDYDYQQQRDICRNEGFYDDRYKIDYAANKQSFFDYLQWLNDSDDFMLEDNTEYINGYINKKRAYFMALAQYQCLDKGILNKIGADDDNHKGEDVFKFLSRLKEFSIEYGCKPGDKMHKWNFNCKIW